MMTLRITWKRAITTLVALAAATMLLLWAGVVPVAASSGHWAVTNWFLHWVMRSSVRTQAAFTNPAEPADHRSMVSAAGHFAQACALCHGAPGQRPAAVMQAASPPAPNLAVNAREWTDPQIFWILKHGVKFSGMPAWPTQTRDDEVRRMTAFVRRLPEMRVGTYRALVGEGSCAGCHGTDWRGRGQRDVPVLGGQRPEVLVAALAAYRQGHRASGVMGQAASLLDPAMVPGWAQKVSAAPGLRPAVADHPIIRAGLPAKQLPACASCHDPAGRKPYPILSGQRASYIAQRLRNWQADKGEVDARLPQDAMPAIARRIPADQIDAIAAAFERAGG